MDKISFLAIFELFIRLFHFVVQLYSSNVLFRLPLILLFCYLSLLPHTASAKDVIRFASSDTFYDSKENYFIDLLKLALEETKAEFGNYEVQGIPLEMSQGRSSIMLQKEKVINLTWRMTSLEQEKKLQAIYIPLLRGLMGYRIFIINKEQQTLFPRNMPLKDLQTLHAGQGYEWQDNSILKHNGFTLIEGASVHLTAMLAKQRFDYFPRALHEAWAEIPPLKANFAVEKHLLLKYTSPVYFFVNKNNTRLAKRISTGLEQLVTSGKLQHFFANHPITKDAIDKSNLSERKVFQLENPFVSEKTKEIIKDKRYWLAVN